MIDVNSSSFAYSATIKLNELPGGTAQVNFPGVTDVAVNSRTFGSYVECVTSAKSFMEDVVKDVNEHGAIKLTVSAEVNPLHSGADTRSKDWQPDEMARLWIFDKAQEGARAIHALGQARIFALQKNKHLSLAN